MKDTRARIERIQRLNADYLQIDLAIDDNAIKQVKPGHSYLVRVGDMLAENHQWAEYLRERWWLMGVTGRDVVRAEVPNNRLYEIGQVVQLMGAIGQPYRFRRNLRNVLLLAYDTPPIPLTVMIPTLLKHNVSVTLVLLGDAKRYQTDHLAPEIEVIRGNSALEWEDMVMTLGWADQIFVVVRPDDESYRFGEIFRAIQARRNEVPDNYLFGIYQMALPCGVGACDACRITLKNGTATACTDGASFDLTDVKLG